MLFDSHKQVGIVAYGVQLPHFKILGKEISRANSDEDTEPYRALGVASKTVPGQDDDAITLSVGAGLQSLQRMQSSLAKTASKNNDFETILSEIQSIFIGSESHPYAVKPSGSVVSQALGLSSDNLDNKPLATADLQFACKAGTQALQIASLYVQAGFGEFAFAIGADTAQAKPGDVLEYTAGAGAASFILGTTTKRSMTAAPLKKRHAEELPLLARLIASTSVATDTPDFWRRPKESYPQHAGRFTGKPGYFYHIELATKKILAETGLKPSDFGYCVFHTPNAKFPKNVATKLGFTPEQIAPSLVVEQIGNTYAAASMIGLASTLDLAKANKKILVVSYGSGAGSDAFVFETTKQLELLRSQWNKQRGFGSLSVLEQIELLTPVNYQKYLKNSKH